MKRKLNAILVVEGKSDVAFLSNYIEAEFVTTNGSDVPIGTIEYLKEAIKSKDVIVLTDPDFPGKKIRDELDKNISGLKHCFINKEKAIKHGKVGVAEADIEEVYESLENLFTNLSKQKGSITSSDLYHLGLLSQLDSSIKRDKVAKSLHLGHCNGKTFLKRINALNISLDELKEAINNEWIRILWRHKDL